MSVTISARNSKCEACSQLYVVRPLLQAMAALEEPKKPMNAYFIFLTESRPALVKELDADAKTKGAVAALGSRKWNALSDSARQPFTEKAAKAKEEYTKALEAFKSAGGEVGKRKADNVAKKQERAAKKTHKESGMPKPPICGAEGEDA